MKIKKIEIELSSLCNAKCPGCLRTMIEGEFKAQNLEIDSWQKFFNDIDLKDVEIKFCGVLGDPLMHPQLWEISKWFIEKEAWISISTNAGLGSEGLWQQLGQLSQDTNRLYVTFSVDGLSDTNHLYRVNTDFETILKNMKTYASSGGKGNWFFIEFNHNLHQIEEVKRLSQKLGLSFHVRRATRNFEATWNLAPNPTTKSSDHSHVEEFNKIRKQAANFDPQSISCKYIHEGEFFIASNNTLWPCCFLWDEYYQKESSFQQILKSDQFPKDWNNIRKHSFSEIIHSDFMKNLENLWNEGHPNFTKRCYKSCSLKGALRNEIIPT